MQPPAYTATGTTTGTEGLIGEAATSAAAQSSSGDGENSRHVAAVKAFFTASSEALGRLALEKEDIVMLLDEAVTGGGDAATAFRDLDISYIGPACMKVIRCTPASLHRKKLSTILHPDDIHSVTSLIFAGKPTTSPTSASGPSAVSPTTRTYCRLIRMDRVGDYVLVDFSVSWLLNPVSNTRVAMACARVYAPTAMDSVCMLRIQNAQLQHVINTRAANSFRIGSRSNSGDSGPGSQNDGNRNDSLSNIHIRASIAAAATAATATTPVDGGNGNGGASKNAYGVSGSLTGLCNVAADIVASSVAAGNNNTRSIGSAESSRSCAGITDMTADIHMTTAGGAGDRVASNESTSSTITTDPNNLVEANSGIPLNASVSTSSTDFLVDRNWKRAAKADAAVALLMKIDANNRATNNSSNGSSSGSGRELAHSNGQQHANNSATNVTDHRFNTGQPKTTACSSLPMLNTGCDNATIKIPVASDKGKRRIDSIDTDNFGSHLTRRRPSLESQSSYSSAFDTMRQQSTQLQNIYFNNSLQLEQEHEQQLQQRRQPQQPRQIQREQLQPQAQSELQKQQQQEELLSATGVSPTQHDIQDMLRNSAASQTLQQQLANTVMEISSTLNVNEIIPQVKPRTSTGKFGPDAGQKEGPPVKRQKKTKIPLDELYCRQCGSTNSPEWRKGPLGPKTLCNACGLAYSKHLQKQKKLSQQQQIQADDAVSSTGTGGGSIGGGVCRGGSSGGSGGSYGGTAYNIPMTNAISAAIKTGVGSGRNVSQSDGYRYIIDGSTVGESEAGRTESGSNVFEFGDGGPAGGNSSSSSTGSLFDREVGDLMSSRGFNTF